MASNRELMSRAEELAKELGTPVRLFGLTHDALTRLVEDLEEKLAQRVLEAAATAPAPAAAPPPAAVVRAPAPASEPPLAAAQAIPPPPLDGATGKLSEALPAPPAAPLGVSVVPGKSITSLRGILGPGTLVTAKDFTHGQATVDDLLGKGILVRV